MFNVYRHICVYICMHIHVQVEEAKDAGEKMPRK